MKDRKRMHRRDPVRSSPDREWRNLTRDSRSWGYRDSDSDPASSAKDGEGRAESWNEVVRRGVKLGYRVIDEEIRRGQETASQINDRSYSVGMMGRDAQDLGVRLARYSGDAWALWLDLLRSPFVGWDPARGSFRPFAASEPHNGAGVAIEVLSARRARVDLHMEPGSDVRRLAALELCSTDAKKAPLKQVAFEHEPGGGVTLSIRVPDGQPSGVYSGVVVDRESGRPLGTLSVRVTE